MRRRHRGGLAVFVHRANEHGVVAGFLGFPLERPPYPTDRIRSLGVVAPPRFPAIQGKLHRDDALVVVVGPALELHGLAHVSDVFRTARHVGAVREVMAVVLEIGKGRRLVFVGERDVHDVAYEVFRGEAGDPQLVRAAHDQGYVFAVHLVGYHGASLDKEIKRKCHLGPIRCREGCGIALHGYCLSSVVSKQWVRTYSSTVQPAGRRVPSCPHWPSRKKGMPRPGKPVRGPGAGA